MTVQYDKGTPRPVLKAWPEECLEGDLLDVDAAAARDALRAKHEVAVCMDGAYRASACSFAPP